MGSNTSTLPITELASHVKREKDFIGLHFFSPVDKMPLIEIISGDNTDPAILAAALDFSVAIRKIPIVVTDSRGFYTSRVIGTVINEAMRMVAEGYSPAIIEAAGRQAGYPAPQLQLADELNLKLMEKIAGETRAAAQAAGQELDEGGVPALVEAMLHKFERPGRLDRQASSTTTSTASAPACGKAWAPSCKELNITPISPEDTNIQGHIIDRMLFIEAIETQKCFDEGVVLHDADANIGSIFGIGYPAWTGGTRQFIKNYDGATVISPEDARPQRRGVAGFVERAEELAERYGARFHAPESLKK